MKDTDEFIMDDIEEKTNKKMLKIQKMLKEHDLRKGIIPPSKIKPELTDFYYKRYKKTKRRTLEKYEPVLFLQHKNTVNQHGEPINFLKVIFRIDQLNFANNRIKTQLKSKESIRAWKKGLKVFKNVLKRKENMIVLVSDVVQEGEILKERIKQNKQEKEEAVEQHKALERRFGNLKSFRDDTKFEEYFGELRKENYFKPQSEIKTRQDVDAWMEEKSKPKEEVDSIFLKRVEKDLRLLSGSKKKGKESSVFNFMLKNEGKEEKSVDLEEEDDVKDGGGEETRRRLFNQKSKILKDMERDFFVMVGLDFSKEKASLYQIRCEENRKKEKEAARAMALELGLLPESDESDEEDTQRRSSSLGLDLSARGKKASFIKGLTDEHLMLISRQINEASGTGRRSPARMRRESMLKAFGARSFSKMMAFHLQEVAETHVKKEKKKKKKKVKEPSEQLPESARINKELKQALAKKERITPIPLKVVRRMKNRFSIMKSNSGLVDQNDLSGSALKIDDFIKSSQNLDKEANAKDKGKKGRVAFLDEDSEKRGPKESSKGPKKVFLVKSVKRNQSSNALAVKKPEGNSLARSGVSLEKKISPKVTRARKRIIKPREALIKDFLDREEEKRKKVYVMMSKMERDEEIRKQKLEAKKRSRSRDKLRISTQQTDTRNSTEALQSNREELNTAKNKPKKVSSYRRPKNRRSLTLKCFSKNRDLSTAQKMSARQQDYDPDPFNTHFKNRQNGDDLGMRGSQKRMTSSYGRRARRSQDHQGSKVMYQTEPRRRGQLATAANRPGSSTGMMTKEQRKRKLVKERNLKIRQKAFEKAAKKRKVDYRVFLKDTSNIKVSKMVSLGNRPVFSSKSVKNSFKKHNFIQKPDKEYKKVNPKDIIIPDSQVLPTDEEGVTDFDRLDLKKWHRDNNDDLEDYKDIFAKSQAAVENWKRLRSTYYIHDTRKRILKQPKVVIPHDLIFKILKENYPEKDYLMKDNREFSALCDEINEIAEYREIDTKMIQDFLDQNLFMKHEQKQYLEAYMNLRELEKKKVTSKNWEVIWEKALEKEFEKKKNDAILAAHYLRLKEYYKERNYEEFAKQLTRSTKKNFSLENIRNIKKNEGLTEDEIKELNKVQTDTKAEIDKILDPEDFEPFLFYEKMKELQGVKMAERDEKLGPMEFTDFMIKRFPGIKDKFELMVFKGMKKWRFEEALDKAKLRHDFNESQKVRFHHFEPKNAIFEFFFVLPKIVVFGSVVV